MSLICPCFWRSVEFVTPHRWSRHAPLLYGQSLPVEHGPRTGTVRGNGTLELLLVLIWAAVSELVTSDRCLRGLSLHFCEYDPLSRASVFVIR